MARQGGAADRIDVDPGAREVSAAFADELFAVTLGADLGAVGLAVGHHFDPLHQQLSIDLNGE